MNSGLSLTHTPSTSPVPAAHATQEVAEVAEVEYVFGVAHLVHEVWLPLTEYVPAGQGRQEVEVPSIKYVPAPQQTDPPLGMQRLTPEPQVPVQA